MEKFLLNMWSFHVDNFNQLRSCIKASDKEQFYHDFEGIENHENFVNTYLGCKKYLMKDREEDLPKSKAKAKRYLFK